MKIRRDKCLMDIYVGKIVLKIFAQAKVKKVRSERDEIVESVISYWVPGTSQKNEPKLKFEMIVIFEKHESSWKKDGMCIWILTQTCVGWSPDRVPRRVRNLIYAQGVYSDWVPMCLLMEFEAGSPDWVLVHGKQGALRGGGRDYLSLIHISEPTRPY